MEQQKLVFSEKTNEDEGIHQEESDSPKIRFPEFNEPWEEVLLKDIASFSKGKGISKNETSEKGIPCIRYGELYTKYDENITEIYSKTNLEIENLVLSEKNDILIPCSGETAIDLATASCVRDENIAIGGDITIIKTNQYAPFITYCLNNKRTEIAKYAQGVSIVHLYAKDFQNMEIKIPQISEQKKIVDLLENLNKKIDSLEKRLVLFKQIEKKVRTDIFDFKNDLSNVTKVQLGEIAEIKKGFTPSTANEEYWKNGEYHWVSIADMNKKYLSETNKKITEKAIKNKQIIKKGTLVMSFKLTIGRLAILEKDMFTNEAIANFDWKFEDISTEYMYFYLKSINIKKYGSQATKGITLNNETLKSIPVYLPEFNQQIKIADILLSFNNKINLIQNQLKNMKNFKKGLLQKMFV